MFIHLFYLFSGGDDKQACLEVRERVIDREDRLSFVLLIDTAARFAALGERCFEPETIQNKNKHK